VELSENNLAIGAGNGVTQVRPTIATNASGDTFITATLQDGGDISVYGWVIDDTGTASSRFIVADDGAIGLNANAENPFALDIVAVNSGRFATLVAENDAFGLGNGRTLDIQVTNPDGTNHQTIELTAASDGEILLNRADIAYRGGVSVAVVYQDRTSSGGDGLWHIAFANVETGFVGTPSLLPLGSATASIRDVQITALEKELFPLDQRLLLMRGRLLVGLTIL